jgi:hypothetical protein
MNEREILEQRVVTLGGLLDAPGGPLGASGGDVAKQLMQRWSAERRLIERILSEATGEQVRPTMEAWRRRTQEFVARSDDDAPGWTDRQGNRWDALEVLELLDDAGERLDSWERVPGQAE